MPLSRYQRYLVAIVPLLLIGIICYYFFDIVTYIILAWILSMVGAPIHNRLEKFIGATGGALVTLLSFSILTFAVVWLFIPPIIQQARNFATINYDNVLDSFEEPMNDWNDWLVDKGIIKDQIILAADNLRTESTFEKPLIKIVKIDSLINSLDTSRNNITIVLQVNNHANHEPTAENELLLTDSFIERTRKNFLSFLNPSRISGILTSIFGALGNTMIGVLSVFFITFFFLKEKGLFNSIIRTISPNEKEDKWVHAIDGSAQLLKRYFIGIVIQIIIITVFITTLLSLLGFENALLIGFFAALMNVIPYLGPLLGAVFAIVITISSHLDVSFYDVLLPRLGILVLVFGSMQLFDNFVVQPNVFSKSVKAHPLEIFIVILVGAKLGGVLGMVVAIPLYTILRVVAKVFLSEFKIVKKITQGI